VSRKLREEVEEVLRLVEAVYVEEVEDDVGDVERCGWEGRYKLYRKSITVGTMLRSRRSSNSAGVSRV
jgi:hypothetical protein